jgi:hypothetical protein
MSVNRSAETTPINQRGSDNDVPRLLRTLALIAVRIGAVASVGLMLYAGRRNNSVVLSGLFTIWVLSPFVILILVNAFSGRWSVLTRKALYTVMLIVTVVTMALYGYVVLRPPKSTGAFMFVIVPPLSCLFSITTILVSGLLSGRSSKVGGNV